MPEKMDVAALPRFERACGACRGFGAEVLVPAGDGSRQLCWMCAHAVAEHDADPEDDASIMAGVDRCRECACTFEQIYPEDVVAKRRAAAEVQAGLAANRNEMRRAIARVEAPDPASAERVERAARVDAWAESAQHLLGRAPAAVGDGTCNWPGCGRSARPPSRSRCGHHDGSHRRAS
jgi:hypothetical protein